MSKRIAFAHIEEVIDFTTKEEAVNFERTARDKGWLIWESAYESEYGWTVVVRKPYRDYPTGW